MRYHFRYMMQSPYSDPRSKTNRPDEGSECTASDRSRDERHRKRGQISMRSDEIREREFSRPTETKALI
ncbi:unnamed protein product [Amoebophrya sp. A120]|nr:unnamed protein product [Amoebophrya sp. A120]|eukprot:GSA120T00001609001.1